MNEYVAQHSTAQHFSREPRKTASRIKGAKDRAPLHPPSGARMSKSVAGTAAATAAIARAFPRSTSDKNEREVLVLCCVAVGVGNHHAQGQILNNNAGDAAEGRCTRLE